MNRFKLKLIFYFGLSLVFFCILKLWMNLSSFLNILERFYKNMYSIENIDCESRNFIIHEPYLFIKREGLRVIFH
jgi:hypothetical protein